MKKTTSAVIAAALGIALPHGVLAQAPTIQTVGPVIHLADNLNEEANLGWCIDTEGRGESDQLHVHSCKPTGDDVLFTFQPDSGMIMSATYADQCMVHNAPDDPENPFGLVDCDATDEAQKFAYDDSSMEIHLGSDAAQCVTVAPTIDDAGPYQSRDLLVAACDDLEPAYKQWVIRE
ncbi:ricin-type beta-trefoil lectin domain protein [Paracoccus sp. 1_MG-2023]|uniref:ricin-type beta-trefoil lectin domain protein n=1 Tax=unclassified Paracoccus (in: a-proteobacteria) TaxID=2688777 RepID=UPI001C09F5EF|nr:MULTISPECIES: ricin-type beta-trefoil lectin domain protein [unclassified Paracoccus (in: a-proteobacteria)]MBU2959189.1 RICIN domain-containing protein [Paracoccus sp. C2R09]MDO6670074.1 ricin-type beta-trefoil lectin domain protein [Paracoccus sp. 1_MG-2023]